MAFGFTPKFEQSLDLNGLNPEHFLVIALNAAQQLEWNVTNISKGGFTAYTGFSMRSWNEEVSVIISNDNVSLLSKCLGNQIIDWGKNKDNIEDFINTFERIQSLSTEEQINEKLSSLVQDNQSETVNESPAASLGKNKSFFSFFVPSEGYYITPIVIDINILVFIMMVLSGVSFFEPNSQSLIKWGADFGLMTLDGQWWRIITSAFIHIGVFHLLMNMYALLYIGLLLEPYLGKLRFIAAYLFTGIFSGLASIYWHPLVASAGASGAIFGMYGVFLAMLTTNIIDKKARMAFLTSIGVFVLFNLMNGMKSGIDNAAHIGGLLSGLIIGYIYYPALTNPKSAKINYLTIGLLFLGALIASFVVYNKIPDDTSTYYQKMKEFDKNDAVARDVFNGKNSPGRQMLSDIKKRGLASWEENLKILKEADKLKVPSQLIDKDSLLRQYCEAQKKKYELLYEAVDQNTLRYDKSIDSCNEKINDLINVLQGSKHDN